MGEREDIEYMVRRSLSILLTDARSRAPLGDVVSFRPVRYRTTGESPAPPLSSLLHLLNLWTSLNSLRIDLAPTMQDVHSWRLEYEWTEDPTDEEEVDWDRTIDGWAERGQSEGFAVSRSQRVQAEDQMRFVAMSLAEACCHARVLSRYFETMKGRLSVPLIEMLEVVQKAPAWIDEILRTRFRSFLESIRTEQDGISRRFERLLEEGAEGRKSMFEGYADSVRFDLPPSTQQSRTVREFVRWRREYLKGEVWLADKVGFEFRAQGSVPSLYELWCFLELSRAAEIVGGEAPVQRSFLNSTREMPTFELGSNVYVYYDNQQRKLKSMDEGEEFEHELRRALPRTRVEWFLLNRKNYVESIVLDSKYRPGWDSREALKVLGYTLNFGVRHGAIVFRGGATDSLDGAERVGGGLFRYDCPSEGGERLFVLDLVPEPAWEERNQLVMQALCHETLAATPESSSAKG